MKRFFSALLLALCASSTLAAPVPITTVTTTTPTIPGNSSLIDEITERTLNPNNSSLIDEITVVTQAKNNMKVIPTNQIGITLVKQAELSTTAALSGFTMGAAGIAGLAYYQRTGKDPVYAAAASVASAADAIFAPAYQAFKATFVSPESFPASAAQYVGKEGSVGGTLGNIYDEIKGKASTYPLISSIFNANQSEPDVGIGNGGVGTVWTYNGQNYKITSPWSCGYLNGDPIYDTYLGYSSGKYFYARSGDLKKCDTRSNGSPMCMATYTSTSDPRTVDPLPGTLNYPSIKDQIIAANNDSAFANEIRSAISNLPSDQKITSADPNPTSVPASSPSPITNNDISNFFTANTTNIYNEYLNTVNNGGDVDTAQAAAELAKAQEEEAEKETEEKFNALDANPFQNPYNPGPFDIPTRFTTFLQNVKSSGLFSFSSAFFDSLPGGGSPVYTVNAGHYGTHTIDLSDTMSTGLAVLKSILLACFGFLSIRAVIMKR